MSDGPLRASSIDADAPSTRASTAIPTEKQAETASFDTRETSGKMEILGNTSTPAGGEEIPKELSTKEIQLVFAA